MNRVTLVGSAGSGKSTLARRLGEITGIEVFHLDVLFWRPGWVSIPKEELTEKIKDIICTDSWIIDGNFSDSMELRFGAADTIIFLDFPLWACLWGILRRRLMYAGRTRPDMREGCTEKLDWDFILWVINFHLKKKTGINEKLRKYTEGKDIFILKNRRAVNKFIAGVKAER